MIILGVFALVQAGAVAIHFLPALRAQIIATQMAAVQERDVEVVEVTEAAIQPAAKVAATPNPAVVAQASQLVSGADRGYRVGDFQSALGLLQQAEALLPDDPSIQFRLGQVYESLNSKAEAFIAFERSIKVPGLPPEIRRQAEQKMAFLSESISAGQQDMAASGTTPGTTGTMGGGPVRDTSGLQPGATLGIVDTKIRDSQPGAKSLRIALKSRPDTKIDARQMNVHVFFYERDSQGDIMVTEATPSTQWISPPIDWAEDEPELLDVEYPLPDGGLPGSSAEMGSPGRTYHGYMVGVYYNGELQDAVAEPRDLERQFPLELYLRN